MLNKPTSQPEYKTLKSTLVISIVAALGLVAGIIMLAGALFGNLQEAVRTTQIIYGISCIVVSSLLFVITTLASDVHLLTYIMQEYTLSTMDSLSYVLSHLREMDNKLDEIKDAMITNDSGSLTDESPENEKK